MGGLNLGGGPSPTELYQAFLLSETVRLWRL